MNIDIVPGGEPFDANRDKLPQNIWQTRSTKTRHGLSAAEIVGRRKAAKSKQRCSVSMAVLSVVSCVLAIIENEMSYRTMEFEAEAEGYHQVSYQPSELISDVLRTGVTLVTIPLVCFAVRYYLLETDETQRSKHPGKFRRTQFIFELLLCLVHIPPFFRPPVLEFEFLGGRLARYRVESLVVLVMLCRLYHVFRAMRFSVCRRYRSAVYYSRLMKIPIDNTFMMKVLLHTRPLVFLGVFGFVLLVPGGYAYRVAEIPVSNSDLIFWNSVWAMLSTATTVGYGEIYPRTHLGRAVCALNLMFGAVLMAVMIAVVVEKLLLSPHERRMVQMLTVQELQKSLEAKAAKCIQRWWFSLRRQWRTKPKVARKTASKFRDFRQHVHKIAPQSNIDQMVEEMHATLLGSAFPAFPSESGRVLFELHSMLRTICLHHGVPAMAPCSPSMLRSSPRRPSSAGITPTLFNDRQLSSNSLLSPDLPKRSNVYSPPTRSPTIRLDLSKRRTSKNSQASPSTNVDSDRLSDLEAARPLTLTVTAAVRPESPKLNDDPNVSQPEDQGASDGSLSMLSSPRFADSGMPCMTDADFSYLCDSPHDLSTWTPRDAHDLTSYNSDREARLAAIAPYLTSDSKPRSSSRGRPRLHAHPSQELSEESKDCSLVLTASSVTSGEPSERDSKPPRSRSSSNKTPSERVSNSSTASRDGKLVSTARAAPSGREPVVRSYEPPLHNDSDLDGPQPTARRPRDSAAAHRDSSEGGGSGGAPKLAPSPRWAVLTQSKEPGVAVRNGSLPALLASAPQPLLETTDSVLDAADGAKASTPKTASARNSVTPLPLRRADGSDLAQPSSRSSRNDQPAGAHAPTTPRQLDSYHSPRLMQGNSVGDTAPAAAAAATAAGQAHNSDSPLSARAQHAAHRHRDDAERAADDSPTRPPDASSPAISSGGGGGGGGGGGRWRGDESAAPRAGGGEGRQQARRGGSASSEKKRSGGGGVRGDERDHGVRGGNTVVGGEGRDGEAASREDPTTKDSRGGGRHLKGAYQC